MPRYDHLFERGTVNDIMDLEQPHGRLQGSSAMPAGFQERDFPAEDWRLGQKDDGYKWTRVNGKITFEEGGCTGATPGNLQRFGRAVQEERRRKRGTRW